MPNWFLGDYWYLLLLLLLPLFGLLMLHFIRWQSARRSIFADARFRDSIFTRSSSFSALFPLLYLLASLFLILSVVDVLSGNEEIKTKQKLNNVIFMLDLSNSMNAEDTPPNRLAVAKNLVIQAMQELAGNRVGIVVFAGEAYSVMPLTTDIAAAENYLSALETSVVQIQGTDFMKGVSAAAEKFKNVPKGSRKIVLISDGEDNEGNEENAIRDAKRNGVSVTTVGIGSDEGAPVPEYLYGQLMGYKNDGAGQTVISKRQTEALKTIAAQTGGEYIDGNAAGAASQLVKALQKQSSESEILVKSNTAVHYYQYLLAPAILLFLTVIIFNPKRDFNI